MTAVVTSQAERPEPRSRKPLRRLCLELALIIVGKLALLMLIWYVAFRPVPRPDTSPTAIERVLAPSQSSTPSPSRDSSP
jgi:hypothetical protein